MAHGRLIHPNQSSSLEIQADDQTVQKLMVMSDGDTANIEIKIIKGYSSSPDIYVAPHFDTLEIDSMSHDVEIISGVPTNRMVKPNSKITVKVITRVEDNSSATFQKV